MSKSKAKGTPIDKVERVLFQTIASMSGWDVARHYKCGYDGDTNVIPHEGIFYDARDWEEYGYANVVEFWDDYDTGHMRVTQGTVHKPDDMERVWRNSGLDDLSEEVRNDPGAQIVEVRRYCGMEPDGDKSFDLDTWQEWRIWRSVHNWLKALGE